MKTKFALYLCLGILLTLICGNVSAQNTIITETSPNTPEAQAVINNAVTNPNVLVITGKIVDAKTKLPVGKAKINFDKFGTELIQASIDEKGNYALALNKSELGDPIRIIFKVAGYKRYTVKSVDKNSTYVDIDVYLQPTESEEKSNGNVTYKMDDNPFNPLVIKMQ
jgi:hypothetical protein